MPETYIVHLTQEAFALAGGAEGSMIGSFLGMITGWKEIRTFAGFSYQVSRNGKRRVVPIEGYRRRGLADHQWVASGVFADDRLSERFRNFTHQQTRAPKRERPAKMDFAFNR